MIAIDLKIKLFVVLLHKHIWRLVITFLFMGVLVMILVLPTISEARTVNNAISDDKSNKILKIYASIYPIYDFVKKFGKEK